MRYLFIVLFSIISITTGSSTSLAQQFYGVAIETQQGIVPFRVEYPRTSAEKARGLMFRTQLADDAGMIFHYKSPSDVTMWMENTYISLDMLFIKPLKGKNQSKNSQLADSLTDYKLANYKLGGEIVHIAKHTTPLSRATIGSGQKVIAVLEIKAGKADSNNIAVGDKVYWDF
ncbi:MAG: DUF192 domain-containing protein [Alphaproteobacteria bacterium]|nr:DUF192 domain-containing protein [Alphaproteobacteria bacterium]